MLHFVLESAPYLNDPLEKNGLLGVVLTGLTNITIFFQDWVMFLEHDTGKSLLFTSDFRTSSSPLYQYLLIPQAWTVGVELTFYLLVPFLSKLRSRTLVALVVTSLVARIFAYEWMDLKRDPWEYRFFPFELALFVMGMLSHRLYCAWPYRKITSQPKRTRDYCLGAAMLVVAFVIASNGVEALGAVIGHHYVVLLSYVAWAIAIPGLFQIFGKWKHDRFIGELSYPIYLSHLIAVSIAIAVVGKLSFPTTALGQISGVLSITLAIVLYVFVFEPLESKRHALAKQLTDR